MILRSEPRKISCWSDLLGQTMVQIKAPLRQMNSATIVFDVLFIFSSYEYIALWVDACWILVKHSRILG